jgi:DNA-binding transcriptional MerR regulator
MESSELENFKNIFFGEGLEKRWKVGQIADLFGISTQTLHHYDRIGLFSPYERDPNTGYRFYLQSQIYKLANIIYMRKQGYSLTEIMNYFSTMNFSARTAELKLQANLLDYEVERIRCISKAIRTKIQYIEGSDYADKLNGFEIQSVADRQYIEIGPEQDLYSSEVFYFFPTVVINKPNAKIFGACILETEDLFSFASYLGDSAILEEHLRVIPAREVLRGFYCGPYETIGNRVFEAIKYAQSHHIKLARYSVHYNIVDQFVESDPNKYITEIQIPILK